MFGYCVPKLTFKIYYIYKSYIHTCPMCILQNLSQKRGYMFWQMSSTERMYRYPEQLEAQILVWNMSNEVEQGIEAMKKTLVVYPLLQGLKSPIIRNPYETASFSKCFFQIIVALRKWSLRNRWRWLCHWHSTLSWGMCGILTSFLHQLDDLYNFPNSVTLNETRSCTIDPTFWRGNRLWRGNQPAVSW